MRRIISWLGAAVVVMASVGVVRAQNPPSQTEGGTSAAAGRPEQSRSFAPLRMTGVEDAEALTNGGETLRRGSGQTSSPAQQKTATERRATEEGEYVVKDFKFRDGESIAELKLHYTTLGKPQRDAKGRVTNAVLILHGTGGSGHQFLAPQFADELFGAGQLLDTSKYFVILPDGIGHGKSSKPSDGMRGHFPHYDYDDMVAGQYALLTQKLGVAHLRLLMGTSMGCMHSFVWAETHPEFMDAVMPLACLPVQIAGRNRMWRKMVMDAIRSDPEWKGGDYEEQPRQGLRVALDFLLMAGSAPLPMQKSYGTRDAADKYLDEYFATRSKGFDANDLLYAVAASRNYDPSGKLETIKAPMTWINSADDFINPPELGVAEREVQRIADARFVLIPASEQTHGHGTHTWAALWKTYLEELLERSEKKTQP